MVINLGNEAIDCMVKNYPNFRDKPLIGDINIDAKQHLVEMAQITEDQRKKAYAVMGDIAKYTGHDVEDIKIEMKPSFLEAYPQYSMFSLSNCSRELATDFISYLVMWCFRNGIPMAEQPRDMLDDVDKYLWMCLKFRKCAICGKPAEHHHVDAVGMGRNRKKIDDSKYLKMALCEGHHRLNADSIHNLGTETFCDRFQVYGVGFGDKPTIE